MSNILLRETTFLRSATAEQVEVFFNKREEVYHIRHSRTDHALRGVLAQFDWILLYKGHLSLQEEAQILQNNIPLSRFGMYKNA